ncbi:hypothetical protein N1030_02660 [Desulfovibrio mangrovi]|uniref:hypothetical protein n=1 Tax=Desulfovibrio mangrovi TaxID=2976983 RepID=UPI00224687D2|nr:hypothetical protein [Desulfovibrio mangrovi]UZP67896.1 hypothetical protein N1030_02660 [Desulfovibrio mangrovi]
MTTVQERRKKAKGQAIIFGALSVALYAAVFSFADTMVHLFAKGGLYTALPIATVFLFSYVHGNFTGNVWTALGIEASAKAGRATEKAGAAKRTDSRNRATVTA